MPPYGRWRAQGACGNLYTAYTHVPVMRSAPIYIPVSHFPVYNPDCSVSGLTLRNLNSVWSLLHSPFIPHSLNYSVLCPLKLPAHKLARWDLNPHLPFIRSMCLKFTGHVCSPQYFKWPAFYSTTLERVLTTRSLKLPILIAFSTARRLCIYSRNSRASLLLLYPMDWVRPASNAIEVMTSSSI